MKKNKEVYIILVLIAIVLAYYLLSSFIPADFEDRTKCPYKEEGNLDADLVIKYVDSPYCVWCWLQEPILKKLVVKKGKSFNLERYDIRYCTGIVMKYGFSGTPSFVFSRLNGTKEYTHAGYLDENSFNMIICSVTGDC